MKKILLIVAVVAAGAAGLYMANQHFSDRGRLTTPAEYTGLARTVSDNTLASPADPAIVMRFAPGFRHLGGQKFILYGVADTEQHFFVETDHEGKLKSVYWIQFEAYLPDNSHQYDYEQSPGRLRLGDFSFYLDTEMVRADPSKRRRGSDGSMARAFLARHGLSFPDDFAYARMVHLTDETRRKELMVIFIEDLAPQGLTAPDLQEGGAQAARRAEVEQAFMDKILATMTLQRPGS